MALPFVEAFLKVEHDFRARLKIIVGDTELINIVLGEADPP
jgi:hypothetical protein